MSVQVTKPAYEFIQIGRETDWQEICAGYLAFFARKRDGSLWAWGFNNFEELGTGSQLSPPAPQRLPYAFEPLAFASGYGNTALLARDGTLWTWGIRLGVPRPSPKMLQFKKVVNDFAREFVRWPIFDLAPFKMDSVPHRLWELPAELRHSLGKEKPDQTDERGAR